MDWLENSSGTILLTGSSDNTIKIWDFNTFLNAPNKSNFNNNQILSIYFDNIPNIISSRNNHEYQFLSSSLDKHIKFWDIRANLSNNKNKSNICKNSSDKSLKDEIKHLKFNNSGSQFAFVCKEGKEVYNLFIYDLGKFEEIHKFKFEKAIYDFVFDKNDNRIFVTSEDGNVYVINIILKKISEKIPGSLFPLYTIDIDKNNKNFITGGNDGLLINYNVEELMSCKIYKRSDQGIKQVMYNYDDKFIASIYDGKNIDFFSTELDDHLYTIFTNNFLHFIKWNKKRNILAYVIDEKKNEDYKGKKNEEGKNNSEGNVHFFIMPNL